MEFVNCTIVGPAVIVLVEDVSIINCGSASATRVDYRPDRGRASEDMEGAMLRHRMPRLNRSRGRRAR